MGAEGTPVPTEDPTPQGATPMHPAPVPGPVVTLIAIMFTGALVFNIVYDAVTAAYSGERITFFLGVVVFAMLGYDVSKLYRRNGSGKPDAN